MQCQHPCCRASQHLQGPTPRLTLGKRLIQQEAHRPCPWLLRMSCRQSSHEQTQAMRNLSRTMQRPGMRLRQQSRWSLAAQQGRMLSWTCNVYPLENQLRRRLRGSFQLQQCPQHRHRQSPL